LEPAAEAAELLQHRPHIEAAQVSQLRGKDAKLDEEFETVRAIVSPRHRPAGALHANSVGLLESKVDAWCERCEPLRLMRFIRLMPLIPLIHAQY
jgi:hypothetical protein